MASRASRSRARPAKRLLRFDRVERAAHWANATLFFVLLGTGAILAIGRLSILVGRRVLINDIHVYCGLALPVPLLLSLAGSWGKGLRADLSRFNRWSADDRRWLRLATKTRVEREVGREELAVGKFNAGQKLNAAFVGGVIVVMLVTGVVMHWYSPWPLSWRTGASFVHDWLALAVFVVILGHITYALRDPAALRSMFTGRISRRWALRNAPAWVVETDAAARAAKTDGADQAAKTAGRAGVTRGGGRRRPEEADRSATPGG
jgi:formate dehydrogenase gamma subunit